MNFNGDSEPSDAISVYSCMAPGAPSAPQRNIPGVGDATSITLTWEAPADNGGCLVTGYRLMRDSGLGASDTITTEVDAASVNNRPTLVEHLVTLTSSETGLAIRFQVIAVNAEGSTISPISQFVLAGVPNKPSALVTVKYAE